MSKGQKKKTACRACWGTNRLETHHVNEVHEDNSTGNTITLCKYCHMQAAKLGPEGIQVLIDLVAKRPELQEQLRKSSAAWLSQLPDSTPQDASETFQIGLPELRGDRMRIGSDFDED